MSGIAGKIMPLPRGAYNEAYVYNMLDMVTYNNKLWVAKQSSLVGVEPNDANSDQWMMAVDGTTDIHILETEIKKRLEAVESSSTEAETRLSAVENASGVAYVDTKSIGAQTVQDALDIIAAAVSDNAITVADIVNALDSDEETKPLAAKQGKALKEYIEQMVSVIDGVNADQEALIKNLQDSNTQVSVQATNNAQTIATLTSAHNNLAESVSKITTPFYGSLLYAGDASLHEVDDGYFQIGSGGYMIGENQKVTLIGADFRTLGSKVLTESPIALGEVRLPTYTASTYNNHFVNDVTVYIPGSAVIALVHGEINGDNVKLTIRSGSGNITIPALTTIPIPPISIISYQT